VTESGGVTRANFGGFTVNLTSVEKAVVLTTSWRGLADLEGSGGKLPDTDRYKAALDTAGVLGRVHRPRLPRSR
jgi:hypothetical protein